jgi:hypothetical protein
MYSALSSGGGGRRLERVITPAMQIDRLSLEAWQRDQPLSILQLDPADRAVLRIAGMCFFLPFHSGLWFSVIDDDNVMKKACISSS